MCADIDLYKKYSMHVFVCIFLCGEREREHDSFFTTHDWTFHLKDVYPILQTPQTSQGACLITVSIKQKYTSPAGFTHHLSHLSQRTHALSAAACLNPC